MAKTVSAWRIAAKRHVALPTTFPVEASSWRAGRWNLVGLPVVYASENISLA